MMQLNKEQLAHYEVAARLYCERIGENADERIPRPHPEIKGVVDMSTRMWHLAADKIHDLSMMLTSLRDAAIAKQETSKIITPP
jgi:hypothetical protein